MPASTVDDAHGRAAVVELFTVTGQAFDEYHRPFGRTLWTNTSR